MPLRTAADLYDQIALAIDHAQRERNIYAVPELAEQLGMVGGETHRGLSQRWKHSFTDSQGDEIILECRWWDTSKSFSPGPDRHTMVVTYSGSQGQRSHSGTYDE